MSIYSVKGKGWRVDFRLNGTRHSHAWYETKTKAKQAETNLRKELSQTQTQTDMGFLILLNLKLDNVANRNCLKYYSDFNYMAKRWIAQWGKLNCTEITREMVEHFIITRKKQVSASTANKEIRYLRSVFNFGKKKLDLGTNPVDGIDRFPVDKKIRYVPTPSDVELVILHARADDWLMARYPDTPDYLETLRDTLARMSEINQLTWNDVNLDEKYLTLYTRKITGGLTPRKIPLTNRLHEVLSRRNSERSESPWVFTNPRTGKPYSERKRIMRRLCEKAEVPYFRFHPLRHAGASLMDNNNVPMGSIQSILGHRNRTTTEIYLHSLGEGAREAIKTFEAASEAATEAARQGKVRPIAKSVREKSLTQSLTQP